MKSVLILCVVLMCCLCLAYAAPADNSNSVQFVKYGNDQDFDSIRRQIIAQYEQLGGSSQFHEAKSQYVDPQHIQIHI